MQCIAILVIPLRISLVILLEVNWLYMFEIMMLNYRNNYNFVLFICGVNVTRRTQIYN